MVKYVLCYGTLMSDEVWEGVTGADPEVSREEASLPGWLKDVGPWGYWEAFPSDKPGAVLLGVLRPVHDPLTWKYLDRFEGVGIPGAVYERALVGIELEDGTVVEAGVYARIGSARA